MKIKLVILMLLYPAIIFADQLYFKDGTVAEVKINWVSKNNLEYKDAKGKAIIIEKDLLVKYVFSDGTAVSLEKPKIDESGFRMIEQDATQPWLLPFPMRFDLIFNKGITKVNIYDNDKDKIADGDADLNQYLIKTSYDPVQTEFYITPEFGFLYRRVNVKDYSYSVEKANTQIEGFIPGIVSDPATGEEVPKDSVSSLAYNAAFYNIFLDVKVGGNLVGGYSKFYLMLNPYFSLGLIEYRKSKYEFEFYKGTRTFSTPYEFSYFSSYGLGCTVGAYSPALRCGIQLGYEWRYFRKFKIADGVVFNEVYRDNELGIMRTHENKASYSDITANLFTISAFCFI